MDDVHLGEIPDIRRSKSRRVLNSQGEEVLAAMNDFVVIIRLVTSTRGRNHNVLR